MEYAQLKRLLAVSTPLGEDVLLLDSFQGTEGLSVPFQFMLDMVSLDESLSFDKIVGHPLTVTIRRADGTERYFNGIVSRFSQGATDRNLTAYRAEIVPWLWLLTQTADCRIFQQKSVPDILKIIFDDQGFQDFRMDLRGTYEALEYCVQYRETTFNFVSRLLEEYGIYYFVEHEATKHTIVFSDHPNGHPVCAAQERATYGGVAGGKTQEDTIAEWQVEQEVRPGKYALTDYNFTMPSSSLAVTIAGNGTLEVYDYPGRYQSRDVGDRLVRVRMEEEASLGRTVSGRGTCRAFTSGYRFELEGHPRADLNGRYVLTALSHSAEQGGYRSGTTDEFSYQNRFSCIPHSVPYRPLRRTPKPVVEGPQTAVVVGKSGEEIWVDQYGRVKVQFHWDRLGKRNENSSCWVRASQNWAGTGWGGVSLPRMGQEVIVDFLEGDPDRPIITGRVYNALQVVPYGLPANATQSGIKSRSSKGGTGSNFNEIRFEDKKGSEELHIQAEKDKTVLVKHDRTENVGHDEKITIGNNRTESVGADESITIGKNRTEKVGVNESVTIGANRHVSVGANDSQQVGANLTIMVGANKAETVAIASAETVGAAKALSVGAAYAVTVGAAMMVSVGAAQVTNVGAAQMTNVAGGSSLKAKSVTITASDEIVLKTGSAQIQLKSNGDITLKGNNITVKGSGNVTIKGSKIAKN